MVSQARGGHVRRKGARDYYNTHHALCSALCYSDTEIFVVVFLSLREKHVFFLYSNIYPWLYGAIISQSYNIYIPDLLYCNDDVCSRFYLCWLIRSATQVLYIATRHISRLFGCGDHSHYFGMVSARPIMA